MCLFIRLRAMTYGVSNEIKMAGLELSKVIIEVEGWWGTVTIDRGLLGGKVCGEAVDFVRDVRFGYHGE